MRREVITSEEVFSQLRLHGLTDIAVVKTAYIEANGMIGVRRRWRGDRTSTRCDKEQRLGTWLLFNVDVSLRRCDQELIKFSPPNVQAVTFWVGMLTTASNFQLGANGEVV